MANVYIFIFKGRSVVLEARLGCLQELLVIALREIRLIVRPTALVAQLRSLHDDAGQLQHVPELPGKGKAGVGPLALVRKVYIAIAVQQLHNLLVGFGQARVVANDGGVLGHGLAQLAPYLEGVLRARIIQQQLVELILPLKLCRMATVAFLR